MIGLAPADPTDLDRYVPATPEGAPGEPAYDVAGLLSALARLEESNRALASRADWFERRLNERERELRRLATTHELEIRAEQARHEALRGNLTDLRRSFSFRLGRTLLRPAFKARDLLGPPPKV
jgi:hypothetical protein